MAAVTGTSTLVSSAGGNLLEVGDTGTVAAPGIIAPNAGTNSSGSAPVLTPTFANNTAAQLSDLTRDYMVYLECTTTGTATTIAIGPTSTPANTIMASAACTAGVVYSVRLPAGWYLKWAGTTTAFATQTAIGC